MAASLICVSCAPPNGDVSTAQSSQSFELVVNSGRVLDPESGLDAIRSVGITGGKIVEISQTPLNGVLSIDASGLVVSPGFIDLHSHGQSFESDLFKVHDGVTTALDLELGRPNIGQWLDERGEAAMLNYGASASHQFARTRAASSLFARTNVNESINNEQIEEMARILDEELSAGGMGIGVGIAYVPGAARAELLRVMTKAAERSVPVFVHVRNPDLQSISEAIDLARETNSGLHIMHINSMALSEIEAALEVVAAARRAGVDVTTELYPYTAGSTFIETPIFDEGWQEQFGVTYSDLQWQDTGERLTAETFEQYRQQGGAVIIHMMREEWIELALAEESIIIASDGMPFAPGAHPRSAGTYARVLGHYVRDRRVLSLPDAIRKMTLLPAQRLEAISPAAALKGRIQLDMDADLTIFDPATIADQATFEDGLEYSSGIEYVIVNGTIVVDGGETVDDVYPGRAMPGYLAN